MTRLAEIEAHLASMGELGEIVGAMRSLAGMRMQEAQHMLPGVRRYADAMAAGIADTLAMIGPGEAAAGAPGPTAFVLMAAEHGFVGGFNERLVNAARGMLGTGDALLVLGSRGAALSLEKGRPADWTAPMATRCMAAPQAMQGLSGELYRRIGSGEAARVELVFSRSRQGGAATIERRLLLPLDTAALKSRQPRQAPLHNLRPALLHERLIAEYVFALLTEAAVESIASENAARLAAMESAHGNVSGKLENLRQQARQARQDEITTEIVELVTGAEALAPAGAMRG